MPCVTCMFEPATLAWLSHSLLTCSPPWHSIMLQGRVAIDHAAAEALLKADLQCHRCGAGARTLPDLRGHLAVCRAPYEHPT